MKLHSTTHDTGKRRAGRRWRDDLDAIALTIAATLRDAFEGWGSVTASDIAIEDHSGRSGGSAYKVTNRANPAAPACALDILAEFYCPNAREPIFFDRQRRAQTVLSEAGLCPHRILEDPEKEWFVEEWAGTSLDGEKLSIDLIEEIAGLIARTHSVDTAWYDDIRRRQCERYPELTHAPSGSHVWRYVSMPASRTFDHFNRSLFRAWVKAGPRPVTEAGSRVVTSHGDAHRLNMVRADDGVRLIDLEGACVTYAIHDISYFIFLTERQAMRKGVRCETDELRQAFLQAYLFKCGLPASPADVLALRLDVERCKMATNYFDSNALMNFLSQRKDDDDLGPVYPRLVAIADRALTDRGLAREIVKQGFEHCQAVVDATSPTKAAAPPTQ